MNEKTQATVDILNRLYRTEMRTVLPRLMNLSLAVSRRHPIEGTLFGRIAQFSQEHREWLIEKIEKQRGSVWPVTLDIHSASSHYLSADSIKPQVQRNLTELIRAYSLASSEKSLEPSARDLVRRIGRRYAGLLEEVEQSTAKAAPVQPAADVNPVN